MKNRIIALVVGMVLLLFSSFLHAQITFERWYGGVYDDYGGVSAAQTSDDGYIIAGTTGSFGAGQQDVYVVRTNSTGDTLWTKTIGGIHDDIGYSVKQTSDGGYIIAGFTESYGAGGADFWLIKTESDPTNVNEKNNCSYRNVETINILSNPFTTATSIHVLGASKYTKSILEVFDVSGRLVESVKLTTNHLLLGTDFPPGVYFLVADGKPVGKVVR